MLLSDRIRKKGIENKNVNDYIVGGRNRFIADVKKLRDKLDKSEREFLVPLMLTSAVFQTNSYIGILPKDIFLHCLYPYINFSVASYDGTMWCPKCLRKCNTSWHYDIDDDDNIDISVLVCLWCRIGFAIENNSFIITDCLYILSCDNHPVNAFYMRFRAYPRNKNQYHNFEVIYNGRKICLLLYLVKENELNLFFILSIWKRKVLNVLVTFHQTKE